MSDKNYYLLELDDMVIALENKDAVIEELKEENQQLKKLLKDCKEFLINRKIVYERNKYYKLAKQYQSILIEITNAIGEKK